MPYTEERGVRASGMAVTLKSRVPKVGSKEHPSNTIEQIIKDAQQHPTSPRALAALNAQLMAYGARQAKKAGVKEGDVTRLIHAFRSRRRSS